MASDQTSANATLRLARLTAIEEFGVMGGDADRAFVAAIDPQVLTSPTGEAVIYVPGYQVTFDQVVVFMRAWATISAARRRCATAPCLTASPQRSGFDSPPPRAVRTQ